MRLLVIEDDKELSEAMCFQLKKEGYEADACYSGEEALLYVSSTLYDLIVLDRMLPEVDGLTLITKIRAKKIMVPVIMVTALNGLNDRIDGLDAGADDYLVKPFAMEELSARIRALLRRPREIENQGTVQYGGLTLVSATGVLSSEEQTYTLSKKETLLLEFFMKNHDQILSRDQILSKVWGPDSFVEDGNIDNYIYFLRRRLKGCSAGIKIKTIHGIGYCLEMDKNVSFS